MIEFTQMDMDPCTHNEMIENNEPGFVWKCADCGYVYGKEPQENLPDYHRGD